MELFFLICACYYIDATKLIIISEIGLSRFFEVTEWLKLHFDMFCFFERRQETLFATSKYVKNFISHDRLCHMYNNKPSTSL